MDNIQVSPPTSMEQAILSTPMELQRESAANESRPKLQCKSKKYGRPSSKTEPNPLAIPPQRQIFDSAKPEYDALRSRRRVPAPANSDVQTVTEAKADTKATAKSTGQVNHRSQQTLLNNLRDRFKHLKINLSLGGRSFDERKEATRTKSEGKAKVRSNALKKFLERREIQRKEAAGKDEPSQVSNDYAWKRRKIEPPTGTEVERATGMNVASAIAAKRAANAGQHSRVPPIHARDSQVVVAPKAANNNNNGDDNGASLNARDLSRRPLHPPPSPPYHHESPSDLAVRSPLPNTQSLAKTEIVLCFRQRWNWRLVEFARRAQ